MAIRHPRSGIAHDLFDALLRFAALAMDVAVLAIALMVFVSLTLMAVPKYSVLPSVGVEPSRV